MTVSGKLCLLPNFWVFNCLFNKAVIGSVQTIEPKEGKQIVNLAWSAVLPL